MSIFNNSQEYNGRTITIAVEMYNATLNISNGSIEELNEGKLILDTSHIVYFMYENSILNPIPRGAIEYDDYVAMDFYSTLGMLNPGNTIVRVLLNDIACATPIEMTFIATEINVIGMEKDRTKYRIELEGYNSILLNKIIPYATTNDINTDYEECESPYDIARAIMIKAGYKESSNSKIPYTSNKIQFITANNTSAAESVKALIAYGIGMNGNNSPVYVVNSISSNSWKMLTMKDMFSREFHCGTNPSNVKGLSYTELTIISPLLQMSGIMDTKVNSITSIKNGEYLSNSNKHKLLNNYQMESYSHDERKWSSYKTTRATMNSLLTKSKGSNGMSIFNTVNGDARNERYYSYPDQESTMLYDVMTTLECKCSQINIDVMGSLKYDAGQIVDIVEKGASGYDVSRLYGSWVVVDIRHSFRNKTYSTNMNLCRQSYVDSVEKS